MSDHDHFAAADAGAVVDAVLRMRADFLAADGGAAGPYSALIFDTVTRLRVGGHDAYAFLLVMVHAVLNHQDEAEAEALIETLMGLRSCRGLVRAALRHEARRN